VPTKEILLFFSFSLSFLFTFPEAAFGAAGVVLLLETVTEDDKDEEEEEEEEREEEESECVLRGTVALIVFDVWRLTGA